MLQDFFHQRKQMVERQLCTRGIEDARILAAFEVIPRQLFMPEKIRHAAYQDRALRIGFGQTISQPYIVAYMIERLGLTGRERILDVGTGSGYQSAILSRLARAVHTIELIPDLAERAAQVLAGMGVTNVFIHIGDGSQGWTDAAPYDAIIVAAAGPRVPYSLLEQPADHGRMVLPVGEPGFQKLELWRREEDSFVQETLIRVAFVPLRGKEGV